MTSPPRRPGPALLLVLCGAALFLSGFTALGLVGELRGRTLDVSAWWVGLGDLPAPVRIAVLGAFAALAGAWAVRPRTGPTRRWATMIAFGLFAALAVRDVVAFYGVVASQPVRPMLPVPLSLLVALLLAALAVWVSRSRPSPAMARRPWTRIAVALAALAWAVAFPLAQMLFFGTTDYRRPADAAVVFGARVYASGTPSPLLADRIRTGVDLYRAGLVRTIVMSGGDGADGFNEAVVMRQVAIDAGVEPSAVLVDPAGVSTEATVANVAGMLDLRGPNPPAVIAVSQAYHLPRVQLAFATAGIDVLTVPAQDPVPIGEWPILVAREVLAWWAYALRICLG